MRKKLKLTTLQRQVLLDEIDELKSLRNRFEMYIEDSILRSTEFEKDCVISILSKIHLLNDLLTNGEVYKNGFRKQLTKIGY